MCFGVGEAPKAHELIERYLNKLAEHSKPLNRITRGSVQTPSNLLSLS